MRKFAVGRVAWAMGEVISIHTVLGLQTSDDGFDGRPAFHLAFDLGCHAPLLTGDEDPELVVGRRVVSAVCLISYDAPMVLPIGASISGIPVASVWSS